MSQLDLDKCVSTLEVVSPRLDVPGRNGNSPDEAMFVTQQEPAFLSAALDDAERLLKYAAEAGLAIDADIRGSVLKARTVRSAGGPWDETLASNLLDSLTRLADQLKPVTAESLKACNQESQSTVHVYWAIAICLAILIVPISVASFVTSAISDTIRKDIVTANELAVRLTSQLTSTNPVQGASASDASTARTTAVPPGLTRAEIVTELQSLASLIRTIDTRSLQLDFFIFRRLKDPFEEIRSTPEQMKQKFQLQVPLVDLSAATTDRVLVYQDVRSFGQSVVDVVSVFYGAITTCLLPVLYALLGTCAYLLRSYEQEMRNKTFVRSHADFPRFMIAAIAGAVVGLFNNFTVTQGASIPPLAIAFLVGYAVDVFFSFLEGMIQTFSKNKATT